jgi:hypothetical protein
MMMQKSYSLVATCGLYTTTGSKSLSELISITTCSFFTQKGTSLFSFENLFFFLGTLSFSVDVHFLVPNLKRKDGPGFFVSIDGSAPKN